MKMNFIPHKNSENIYIYVHISSMTKNPFVEKLMPHTISFYRNIPLYLIRSVYSFRKRNTHQLFILSKINIIPQ